MTEKNTNVAVKYFLPYQIAWLEDKSMLKIWEKTRRGGMTYVQSFEDTCEAIEGKWDVWFSSADQTAAFEYIRYCQTWSKLFNDVANFMETTIFDNGQPIKSYSITFNSGCRITALSSSPTQFRSKGGKVVLDEFAFHEHAAEMWTAAEPTTTWGFPLRILSTHHGTHCKYYELLQDVKSGKIKGTWHRTDIYEAIAQGLLDKIKKRPTTDKERAEWIAEKQARVGSTIFNQEYKAIADDSDTAFLSEQFIIACERTDILHTEFIPPPTDGKTQSTAELYEALTKNIRATNLHWGVDIGRTKNLTVFWGIEYVSPFRMTRHVIALKNQPFRVQWEFLKVICELAVTRRVCIDHRGIGMQMAEDAIEKYGKKVEAIDSTNELKERMALDLEKHMEAKHLLIPYHMMIRADFNSVQTEMTPAGNKRYIATTNKENSDSHADFFSACCLGDLAVGKGVPMLPEARSTNNKPRSNPDYDLPGVR